MGMQLKDFGKATVASIIKACIGLAAGSDEIAKAIGYTENAGSPVASITPDFIGQIVLDTTGGVFYKSNGLTSNSWIAQGFTKATDFVALATASPVALTGAQVCDTPDNVINMTTNLGAGGTLNLPTAAQMIAAMPGGGGVGSSSRLRIINSSAGAFSWTVSINGDANITLNGTATIAQNTFRDFLVTMTAATTVTVQQVGTGTTS